MDHLGNVIDPAVIAAVQAKQFESYIPVSDIVAAGETKTQTLNIDNSGDFMALELTGDFTTTALNEDETATIDNGICDLSVRIRDEQNSTQITNDFIPLNLLLTQGRVRSKNVTGDTSPFPQPIYSKGKFIYLFSKNSTISFEVKNGSTASNSYNLCFRGVRFTNSAGN